MSNTPADWHKHGLTWGMSDAMASPCREWTLGDIARAFAAGAAAAEAAQAQPAAVPMTRERHFALREGLCIGASDNYFKLWPTHDNDAGRMLFERGFVRGFDAGEKVYAQPVAVPWREHVEQRLRSWRQTQMNRSGDRLALDDFMSKDSIEDLIDYVCDEWADPAAQPVAAVPAQAVPIPVSGAIWNGNGVSLIRHGTEAEWIKKSGGERLYRLAAAPAQGEQQGGGK